MPKLTQPPATAPRLAENGGSLRGQVALVTGATRGIGRAISLELLAHGAVLAAGYARDEDAAARLLRETSDMGGGATLHRGDLSTPSACTALVDEVLHEHARVDILVCSAGLAMAGAAVSMPRAHWDSVIALNLSAAFRLAALVLPHMLEAGGGRIVHIGSLVAERAQVGQVNDAAAKAGLIGLTKSLAREAAFTLLRREGIPQRRGLTVNAVAPGFIETGKLAALPPDALEGLVKQIPVRRLGQPEEVARVVRFLCEEQSAYITGQTWHVNGGVHM
jgi:acetoacetyl-CoA reductase/3-oxoacyl-[acyl-carrier protein] reductase